MSDSLPLDRHEKEQNIQNIYREREGEREREEREGEGGRVREGERERERESGSRSFNEFIFSHMFHYSHTTSCLVATACFD